MWFLAILALSSAFATEVQGKGTCNAKLDPELGGAIQSLFQQTRYEEARALAARYLETHDGKPIYIGEGYYIHEVPKNGGRYYGVSHDDQIEHAQGYDAHELAVLIETIVHRPEMIRNRDVRAPIVDPRVGDHLLFDDRPAKLVSFRKGGDALLMVLSHDGKIELVDVPEVKLGYLKHTVPHQTLLEEGEDPFADKEDEGLKHRHISAMDGEAGSYVSLEAPINWIDPSLSHIHHDMDRREKILARVLAIHDRYLVLLMKDLRGSYFIQTVESWRSDLDIQPSWNAKQFFQALPVSEIDDITHDVRVVSAPHDLMPKKSRVIKAEPQLMQQPVKAKTRVSTSAAPFPELD